ncbi:uncharacterized protein LOC119810605 [Arvicola amphibius]|uniref:uncharacterized protein LOC119810605 n=1 Tax=Arvicola amphibius TaxID=1047088 RepID=UPI001C0A5E46|nr:uncharacterized protein LOC119810605 [Arvicola amphibius]
MKKIFKGHLPWGFLGFRHANAENQEWHRYLTGYTPVKKIHKAASMGDITQVQKMLEFGDVNVNITDRKKRTALHYACAHGQAEMATLLLWYECNIEARDSDESTALIKAAQRRHEECVKVLLKNGANSNAIDANQNTALHYAVHNNSASIASTLLEFRANTEIKAKNGYTPLILAVLENKLEMVELLLRAASNINAVDNFKRSALIHAVRAQSKDMISLLLQQGADVSLVDVYGATAQSYTVFETFQVLSKGPSSTTREDRYNSDAKKQLSSVAEASVGAIVETEQQAHVRFGGLQILVLPKSLMRGIAKVLSLLKHNVVVSSEGNTLETRLPPPGPMCYQLRQTTAGKGVATLEEQDECLSCAHSTQDGERMVQSPAKEEGNRDAADKLGRGQIRLQEESPVFFETTPFSLRCWKGPIVPFSKAAAKFGFSNDVLSMAMNLSQDTCLIVVEMKRRSERPEEGARVPGTGITDGSKLPSGFWKQESGPLEETQGSQLLSHSLAPKQIHVLHATLKQANNTHALPGSGAWKGSKHAPGNAEACMGSAYILVSWSELMRMTDQVFPLKEQVPPRHELRSLDSESRALTITPQELVHRGMNLAPTPRTSKPTTEEDENSVSSKSPVVPSPLLTESSLWIGYPKDWPEPMKFSRQPAVYNPIEWREDMESRSVPLDKNKQPMVVFLGNEANVQTHKQPARVFEEPDANDSDPTEKENAKDELVSLITPLEENKPQIKEFSVTEAVKLERWGEAVLKSQNSFFTTYFPSEGSPPKQTLVTLRPQQEGNSVVFKQRKMCGMCSDHLRVTVCSKRSVSVIKERKQDEQQNLQTSLWKAPKLSSKWVEDPNLRANPLELIRENVRNRLELIDEEQDVNSTGTKTKNKWSLMKLKSFRTAEEPSFIEQTNSPHVSALCQQPASRATIAAEVLKASSDWLSPELRICCSSFDKDKLEKHPLAPRASQCLVKRESSSPLQLQKQDQEPEASTDSDGEDGDSRSAKGQVLRGVLIEGDRLEGEDTVQLAINKLSQKVGEAVKITVHHEEERPREDSTGKTSLKSATPKLAWDMRGCEARETAAALAAVTLQTYPRQKEGGLRNISLSPSFSQVLEHSGQSVTKSPLMKNKLDYESNKFEIEESLHKSKEKSSKTTESGKRRGKCPEVCMGGKQEGCEVKSQLQKTLIPKGMAWQLDSRHMSKSSDSKRLSESTERSRTSEFNSWSDSTLGDTHKKSKGTPDLTQKPLHSNCEAPVRTVGTASAAPPGGRTASALAGEAPQDRLSDSEFQILEEEILAWEKVHLENESVSENLPNKCEGISSDATGQRGNYLENEHTGAESDSEETTQSEQKTLDGSENTQLQHKVLSKTCPQTQNTSADPARPTHPQYQKESTQSHPPPLHLEKMSEEPEINKKSDGECASVYPEVPAVKAHEKVSITRDITGNNGKPDKHSCELQHTARDVLENICPEGEPLPGSYRGRNQFQVEEMSKKRPSPELKVSECPVVTDCNDSGLIVRRKGGRTEKLLATEEKDELAKSVSGSCMKEIKKPGREAPAPRQPVITPVFEKSLPEAAGLLLVKEGHHLSEMGRDEGRLSKRQAKEKHKVLKADQGNLDCRLSDITLGGATAITAAMSITITLSSEDVNLQPPSAHCQYCPPQACTMGVCSESGLIPVSASGHPRVSTYSIPAHCTGMSMEGCYKPGESICSVSAGRSRRQGAVNRRPPQHLGPVHASLSPESQNTEVSVFWALGRCPLYHSRQRTTSNPSRRALWTPAVCARRERHRQPVEQGQYSLTVKPRVLAIECNVPPLVNNSKRDSSSLLKLWDMIHSYERLMALKNSHCELLTRKLTENMENRAGGEQREQAEVKSWLQHRGGEWEDLRTLRFPLKPGEKQEQAESMFQQNKMQLSRREEQCGKNVEQTQHREIGKIIADAKAIENDLRQLYKLRETWETTYYKYLHTVVKLQFMEQELAVIKTEQKKCGRLLESHRNLEEDVLHCRGWVREHAIQARNQNKTKDLRDADEVVMIDEMELRIKSLESQLATRGAQHSLWEGALPSEHHCAGKRGVTQPLLRELGEQASRSLRK